MCSFQGDRRFVQAPMIWPREPKMSGSVRNRILHGALLVIVSVVSMGARYQSANFTVETADAKLAPRIAQVAEKYRHELAVEWLGQAMPNWSKPCTMTVQVGEQLVAGGATTSVYDRGTAFVWRMTVQGSSERIFDSVLPHEITHAIFASHFRRQLPRWADEGGAMNLEPASVKAEHRKTLLQILRSGRGIALPQMFAMTEYPQDMLPLYTQGYSVAEFLIERGGRRKYVDFLDDGLKRGDWSAAVRRHYGISGLGELQAVWSACIDQGFPTQRPAATAVAAIRKPGKAVVPDSN
jgi:hypothetical protein